MKWTIAGLILVGLIAAVSAAVLAVTLKTNAGGPRVAAETEEVEVMVATRALPANVMVDSTAVGKERMKRADIPQRCFTNSAQVIGRVLVAPVLAGQAFTAAQFASTESSRQLVASIPEGHRAVGVMLTDETGIEDMLYPGSIVDVIASMRLPTAGGGVSAEGLSVTLLQGLQVLAVGNRSIVSEEKEVVADAGNNRKGRMVTLLVNTAQAEMLQLASSNGKITVAMRNPLDQEIVPVTGTKISDLSKDVAGRIAQLAESEVTPTLPLTPPDVTAQRLFANNSNANAADASAPVVVAPVVPEAPLWTTIIHRGRAKEVQKFPMPAERDVH